MLESKLKSHDNDEPTAPLEAYYAAPNYKPKKLLDKSEWSLIEKIFWCNMVSVECNVLNFDRD